MAGNGSRFAESGESEPKPFIQVVPGKRMVEYAIEYLTVDEPHRFIFVCLKRHDLAFGLKGFFSARTDNFDLVLTEKVTSGPAASALLADNLIETPDELLIAYCDCFLNIDVDEFLGRMRKSAADGGLITYPSTGGMEAYVELASDGRVLRTAEKQRIGPLAAAGLYYFKDGQQFVRAARRMIADDQQHGRESFVCPVFNNLIAAGKSVLSHRIERAQRIEMGTPEDLASSRLWLGQRPTIARWA